MALIVFTGICLLDGLFLLHVLVQWMIVAKFDQNGNGMRERSSQAAFPSAPGRTTRLVVADFGLQMKKIESRIDLAILVKF